jgi:hypothetical protein
MDELNSAIRRNRGGSYPFAIFFAAFLVLVQFSSVQAQSATILLDGLFDDWLGQPNVPDIQGDAWNSHTDISAFYFTNNPDQDYLYFMAERWEPGAQGLDLRLIIDTNNNGDMTETVDRMIDVQYHPNEGGRTDVNLYDGAGGFLNQIADRINWGEPGNGSKVEWGVTFSDLGIAPYQTIRIQLVSYSGNKVSDDVAEVQWSPANALGWYLLVFLGTIGLGWLYHRRRALT